MIPKSYITENLKQIERLYNSASSIQRTLFYSKLAVIELCGWIEMSMDDIALRVAKRHLRDPNHLKLVATKIKKTYGFDYEYNFLPMIEITVGRHGIEKMNGKVDSTLVVPLIAALSTLKTARNGLAHQYIKGTTLVIDAPSVTAGRFPVIYNGLKDIEKALIER